MANTVTPDGARIRRLRIQRGWTQEQLAGITGVSTRSIQRTERGSATSLETLRALAAGFSIDVSDLLPVEAAAPIPPAGSLRDRRIEARRERLPLPPPVAEPSLIRPGGECRDIRLRNIRFQFSSLPDMAVLTMSVLALVAAVVFVGHGWSSRYAAQNPAVKISVPAIVSANLPVDTEHGDSEAALQKTLRSLAASVPSAPAAQSLPATDPIRGADEAIPHVRAPSPVNIEAVHMTAAWPEPLSDAAEAEGSAMLRAEARSRPDLAEPLLLDARTETLNMSPSSDTSNSVSLRVTLWEAGRKTGGFFAKAGSSIGASMKAAF